MNPLLIDGVIATIESFLLPKQPAEPRWPDVRMRLLVLRRVCRTWYKGIDSLEWPTGNSVYYSLDVTMYPKCVYYSLSVKCSLHTFFVMTYYPWNIPVDRVEHLYITEKLYHDPNRVRDLLLEYKHVSNISLRIPGCSSKWEWIRLYPGLLMKMSIYQPHISFSWVYDIYSSRFNPRTKDIGHLSYKTSGNIECYVSLCPRTNHSMSGHVIIQTPEQIHAAIVHMLCNGEIDKSLLLQPVQQQQQQQPVAIH